MFECIKFIFKLMTDFMKMLFSVDIGNNMTLGMLMCIIFIFLPAILSVINFLKHADDLELAEMFKKNKSKKESD